tara:strand:+ start:1463 stop:2221 length:759 start_codon:yes stop_codon:yes gene_type:complete
MPHMPFHQNPYQFDWNTTPSGGRPPAEMNMGPEAFLRDFSNIDVQNLSEEDQVFLPNAGQMMQNIGAARTGLGFNMAGQQLSGQRDLLQMTGNQGLSSTMNSGFGRRDAFRDANLNNISDAYQMSLQGAIGDYRGDVLSEQYRYEDALTGALANLIRSGEATGDLKVLPLNRGGQQTYADYDTGLGSLGTGYLGSGDAITGVGTSGVGAFPEGFPSAQQYQAWLNSGADPNTATSFGFTGPSSILFGLGNQV